MYSWDHEPSDAALGHFYKHLDLVASCIYVRHRYQTMDQFINMSIYEYLSIV